METASFYHFFHTEPTGRYRIYLSDNVIAKMRGFQQVRDELERRTGARFGGPATADFSLFETACIGLSDQEPTMLIDGVAFTRLTPESVTDIIASLRAEQSPEEIANPAALPRTTVAYVEALTKTTVHTAGPVFFHPEANHLAALHRSLALTPEQVIASVTQSRLHGRGGAGFSTGSKWQSCRDADGREKYVICNADEGEPGTFKDRVLLTTTPKQVFAGMMIAAHAIGAAHGIVYLRAEYAYLRPYLEQQLSELRERRSARRRLRHPYCDGRRILRVR